LRSQSRTRNEAPSCGTRRQLPARTRPVAGRRQPQPAPPRRQHRQGQGPTCGRPSGAPVPSRSGAPPAPRGGLLIHKIIKGSYFKGALRYVLDPNKGLLIGGTFGSHQSPAQVAHEMHEVAGDRLRKPVFHAVLSLRPGESLSNDQWNEAARRYLSALGYDDTPYVLVRHTNREHDHVHIIASRVRYDGSVVSDRQDRFKGLAAVRELSREYGL